ncbi:MAG: 50S ribosomal protein L35 [Candidatus Shikimatogenerans bostrichidophilus]|nr:MAG: 50S ribosomal protein L35 [Candidatus Shikimatogenerans bostrichidophilus]
MMKLKNKSSFKKRFRLITDKKIKRRRSNKNHNLTKKSKRRKKRLSRKKIINIKLIK